MEPRYRLALTKSHVALVNDLDVKPTVDYLLSKLVITREDSHRILVEKSDYDKRRVFLNILPERGQKAFPVFTKYLADSQPWLHSSISESLATVTQEELDTLLEQFQQLSTGGSTSQTSQKTGNIVGDSAMASCTGRAASRTSRPGPPQLDLESVNRRAQDLFECVKKDQLVKAKTNLKGLSKGEKQKIVSRSFDGNTPLCLAARQGQVLFVNYLLEECGADIEQLGVYVHQENGTRHQVTPLLCAAAENKLEVVKTLIRHRANVNATSDTESTPVRSACYMTNIEVVKCLVENGADIHKPNIYGNTCLMISMLGHSVELCSLLIQKGANVNAQDNWGKTALHHAIDMGKIETVKLLMKHNSNPYLKNKDGDDALQTASLQGQADILEYLISKIRPSVERQVEVYELLGCYFVHNTDDIQRALQIWRSAMELRYQDPHNVIRKTTVTPPIKAYDWAREPESLEELQEIASNADMVYMLALLIRERILGPGHDDMIYGIEHRGAVYADTHHYQRCVDLWKYAFKLRRKQQKSVKKCLQSLECLCGVFWEINTNRFLGRTKEAVQFSDVIEVLEMAASELESAQEAIYQPKLNQPGSSHPKEEFHTMLLLVLHLIHLLCKMPKDEQQMCRFKKAVHHLVRLNPQAHQGSKLLHLAVQQKTTCIADKLISEFLSLDVVKVLIECGTDVNCLDDDHNTPLHLCSSAQNQANETKEIVRYLIAHHANPDAKNKAGQKAVQSIKSPK